MQLEVGDCVGRIAEGYQADLVLWERITAAQIAYEFDNTLPRTVFVGGQPWGSG